ncbi:LLM class flavin-dependent oxidoreductase [Pseudonocardia sp. TRM90224]|uniref:LLM class flavin-dependent oxidoreductase n=1 Tax=Pseudonocardia sp. TRM90224 TaxID=2812678 RepID=UPI001E3CFC4F|nr:LLM class flavin-dependent oxidoreductase [Pseudonocardia sp. TRM90224]
MPDDGLRYGLYLPPFGPFGDPAGLVDLAVRAEAAGWDGLFLWDHVVTTALPIVDSWSVLAAITQATSRITIGPMVTPLPRRRPWVVARQASTVSRLSGGRLVLGVGLGSDESGDFSRFGEPAAVAERAVLLDEGIGLVKAMWSGAPGRHRGRYDVELAAAPPEPHPIPIWCGSSVPSASGARRAAGCDGIFPNPEDHVLTPDEVATAVAAVHAAGRPAGSPLDVAVRGNASPAWNEPIDVDLAGLVEAGMTWWLESLIHFDPLELSLAVVDAGPPR